MFNATLGKLASRTRRPLWQRWRTNPTDYKALIGQAKGTTEKVPLAQKLATRRPAMGSVPDLDARFAVLELKP
jgi:hypothetical protein